LAYLFDILTHASLRGKSYCRAHLKKKIVGCVRAILQWVPFEAIIKQVSSITGTKNMRFKAVKELVNDVFSNKSQEYEMCVNA